MHGVGQEQALLDAAFSDSVLALLGDIRKSHAGGNVECQVFGVGFHMEDGGCHPPLCTDLMGAAGFEPAKAEPADLQSAPFGHLGMRPVCGIYAIYGKWST